MNYLAHAYLSFGNPDILTGNMISDFVKGKKKLDYPEAIQKGITLHRAIDTFTDTHDLTRQAKTFFKPVYGLYAGALVDVIYDHYLANDPLQFSPEGADTRDSEQGAAERSGLSRQAAAPTLAGFAEKTYQQLAGQQGAFPERFARMFGYMRSQNWLYNYRTREGIFNSLAGLARRARYMPDPAAACRIFEAHYEELAVCYAAFFPALKDFAFTSLQDLLGNPLPLPGE